MALRTAILLQMPVIFTSGRRSLVRTATRFSHNANTILYAKRLLGAEAGRLKTALYLGSSAPIKGD